MNGDRRPHLTIEHELPGRLRIRLSHALNEPERVRRLVAEHAGVAEVRYTAVSRSLLVRFDANYISTGEILVRIATGFSLERDYEAVRILTRPPTPELSDSAFYSGIALIAAFAWRLARGYANPNVALEYATGLATAGAVLNHGWMDYRSQGNFDPELLAVTYLLAALARGNPLPAAAVTWISSFGRHLIRLPARGIVVRPALTGYEGVTPIFEVIVAPDPTPPDKITFFGVLPTLAFRAMTRDAFARHANFLEEVRRVADTHDQVLEGVSDFRRGIRLSIRGTAHGVAEP